MTTTATDLALASATDQLAALDRGTTSSRELVEGCLDRIERLDARVNAVVACDAAAARAAADVSDRARAAGEPVGPLHGLPMTIKDNQLTRGLPTTYGTRRTRGPDVDDVPVARLRAAGAVIIGKTNTPPFAQDIQTYNRTFGTTTNPWDATRTSGGSSGGAAAAVAVGMSALELGNDLGGSIRLPAAYCGVYGHKSSFGLVPDDAHPEANPRHRASMDIAVTGPIARSAEDLDLMLGIIAGPKPDAAHAVHVELPEPRARRIEDFRVGVWLNDPACPTEPDVLERLEGAIDAIRATGAKVTMARPDVDLKRAFATYQQLLYAAISNGIPTKFVIPLLIPSALHDPVGTAVDHGLAHGGQRPGPAGPARRQHEPPPVDPRRRGPPGAPAGVAAVLRGVRRAAVPGQPGGGTAAQPPVGFADHLPDDRRRPVAAPLRRPDGVGRRDRHGPPALHRGARGAEQGRSARRPADRRPVPGGPDAHGVRPVPRGRDGRLRPAPGLRVSSAVAVGVERTGPRTRPALRLQRPRVGRAPPALAGRLLPQLRHRAAQPRGTDHRRRPRTCRSRGSASVSPSSASRPSGACRCCASPTGSAAAGCSSSRCSRSPSPPPPRRWRGAWCRSWCSRWWLGSSSPPRSRSAGIVISEELRPDRRGAGLTLLGIIAMTGFGLVAIMLLVVPLTPLDWRILYVAALPPLLLVAWLRRNLRETKAFTVAAGGASACRASFWPQVDRVHRPLLWRITVVLGTHGLLATPMFFYAAELAQDGYGWEGLFTVIVIAAGPGHPPRLRRRRPAERPGRAASRSCSGRSLIVIVGVLLVFSEERWLFAPGFFLLTGADAGLAAVRPSYLSELFPTEVRATLLAFVLAVVVAAGSLGLVVVGVLEGVVEHPRGHRRPRRGDARRACWRSVALPETAGADVIGDPASSHRLREATRRPRRGARS